MAAIASLLPLGYAYEILRDLHNPDVPVRETVLVGSLMSFIALTGFVLGIRFLLFAFGHHANRTSGWAKPLFLGAAFFFSGFVFSLSLTILLAKRIWPSDDGKLDLAMEVSVFIGVAAAVICSVVLFRKRGIKRTA
jgi:hypothetical protein